MTGVGRNRFAEEQPLFLAVRENSVGPPVNINGDLNSIPNADV